MSTPTPTDEPILPRLLASNALRANLTKHMQLNQMADSKASMILTASSLIITITLTQYHQLDPVTFCMLLAAGVLAILCSIFAIIPPLHVRDQVNLFYFRSFSQLSEEEFVRQFKECIADKDKLYDAYLHEIYYLGEHRLRRKYRLIANGLWALLTGFCGAVISTVNHHLL